MLKDHKFLILNIPSPPHLDLYREYAGGYATAYKVKRNIYGHTGWVQIPIFMVYSVSALLKSGMKFQVFDGQAKRSSLNEVLNVVKKAEPDILISLLSLPSLLDDLKILNEIKKLLPETKIVCLGTVCNTLSDDIVKNNIDFVIRGMYPYYNSIINVTEAVKGNIEKIKSVPGAVYYENGSIIHSPLDSSSENLDGILLQAYKELPMDIYAAETELSNGIKKKSITVLTGTGCPYPCIYCPYPVGHGKKIVKKSIDTTISEIEFLKNNYSIEAFIFKDPLFTVPESHVLGLCNEINKKDININWLAETRVDSVTKDLLSTMNQSGCYEINFGLESGDMNLHSVVGKPGVTMECTRKAFKIAKEVGLETQAHLILGLPGEDNLTWRETYRLICNINPDYINLNLAIPYPGTKLFEVAKEKGWIERKDYHNFTSFDFCMRTEELTIKQLENIKKNFLRKIFFFKFGHDHKFRKKWSKIQLIKMRNKLSGFHSTISKSEKRHF